MDKKDIEARIAKLKQCLGNEDEASLNYVEQTLAWAKENNCSEVREAFSEFADLFLTESEAEVKSIRQELDGDSYSLLPLSYIARRYFAKSAAWLQQRVNGYKVRGKVYTLNDEQKKIFNDAVQDIAKRIGSIHFA